MHSNFSQIRTHTRATHHVYTSDVKATLNTELQNAVVWLYSQFTSSARPLVVGERHGPATVGLSAGYPLDLGKAAEVRESPSQSQSSPMFGEPYRGLAEEQRGTEAIDAEEQPSGYVPHPFHMHGWGSCTHSSELLMHLQVYGSWREQLFARYTPFLGNRWWFNTTNAC